GAGGKDVVPEDGIVAPADGGDVGGRALGVAAEQGPQRDAGEDVAPERLGGGGESLEIGDGERPRAGARDQSPDREGESPRRTAEGDGDGEERGEHPATARGLHDRSP